MRPEILPDYIGIRNADRVDKTQWLLADHICAFILRLLNYRGHIEVETNDTRTEFMRQQATFAQSFGGDNPFYQPWDASDKWVACYLLYTKLAYEHDRFAINHLHGKMGNYERDARKLANNVINPAIEQEHKRIVDESKWPWYKHVVKNGRFSSQFIKKIDQ
ncbi:hypothetical protein F4779DRAFT_593036 [Xylariaceae sp. FL0662B]|nr:hypothetical protein F4779DRAFT_593036 [Xylariaceae sp. FL0662B]